MIVTDANLTPTLLLDECVCSKIIDRIDKYFGRLCTSVQLVGKGVSDEQIRDFAKTSGHVIVTKDWGMVRECLEQNINMAIYFRGKAYRIRLDCVYDLTEDEGEPVFNNKKKREQRQAEFLAMHTRQEYWYAHP